MLLSFHYNFLIKKLHFSDNLEVSIFFSRYLDLEKNIYSNPTFFIVSFPVSYDRYFENPGRAMKCWRCFIFSTPFWELKAFYNSVTIPLK